MPYNPTTIANYFIKEHKSDGMTPMKVIKTDLSLVLLVFGIN